jgi:6-phosphogluconolactonase
VTPDVIRHADAEALVQATAGRVIATLVERIADADLAHLCLTGGRIGTALLSALADAPAASAIDWSRVHVWWGDERFLPQGDPDRNDTGARSALLDRVAIPAANVHAIAGPDTADSVESSAAAYAQELAAFARPEDHARVPEMDVLLLSIGPDGHVASLFPEHPATRDDRDVAGVHGSPKPPPLRVTLTFRAINAAREVWVLASGAEKDTAVRLALSQEAGPVQIPGAGVRGQLRTLFLIDESAAGRLPADFGRPGA